jgi:hypothetical protein
MDPGAGRGSNQRMRHVGLWVLLFAMLGAEMWWLAGSGDDVSRTVHAPEPGASPVAPPSLAGHPAGQPVVDRDASRPGIVAPTLRGASYLEVASGYVEDASGRPIEGAGVYALDGDWISAEAATDAEGRFTISVSAEGQIVAQQIAAVARGNQATVVPLDPDRRSSLRIRLTPDVTHGRLEITLVQADGSPAGDAHVWVAPAGQAFPPVLPPPPVDDPLALTRRLRARLEHGADLADQEFEVGQGCSGISALHPDAAGRVHIPALPPGSYRVVAARRIDADGRDLPPDETLMISVYCTDGNTTGAETCVDEVVDVAPPPATTVRRLVLRRARIFEGRVVVDRNPAWGSKERHWCHVVTVEGCPWSRAEVESGASTFARITHDFSGDFRLEGLPRTACRLLVSTGVLSDVTYDLPAVPDTAPYDGKVRDIHVADGRVLSGAVTWSDGSPLLHPADLCIEGYAGTVRKAAVEIAPPGRTPQGARYFALLDRPLLGTESALLRLESDSTREYRLPLAAYAPDRPETLRQDLVIPALPPPARDGATDSK